MFHGPVRVPDEATNGNAKVTLSFDALSLPPLAAGMRRTFLLYASGYSKEMDLYSASPDVVAPVPALPPGRSLADYAAVIGGAP